MENVSMLDTLMETFDFQAMDFDFSDGAIASYFAETNHYPSVSEPWNLAD